MTTEVMHMPLRDPFRIARAEDAEAATSVLVELAIDGQRGIGEAFPVPYYGETVETTAVVLDRLHHALDDLGPVPDARPGALAWLERAGSLMSASIGGHGGAEAGPDIALPDLAARGLQLPLR